MGRWFTALALGMTVASCDAKDEGGPQACDPFAATEEPIALRTILGIGRDAGGTIYLADTADVGEDHVFVSTDGELVRRRIAGSGGGGNAEGESFVFSLEEPPLTLQISKLTAAPMRMGIVPGQSELFEIGEMGEELEVLEADAIADMPLRNFSGEIVLEYSAEAEDGEQLVVTRPADDWDYPDFRLFLGPPDALEERILHDVGRELDGGTTTIEFEIDGTPATAYFPTPYHDLPWTLTIGGETTELTQHDAVPEGVAFRCLAD